MYDNESFSGFGMLINLFLNSSFGIIFLVFDKRNMKWLYVLFLVLLLVVSVGLIFWFVLYSDENNKVVDSSELDREYRWLLQRLTTLLSEYEVTHFVYGNTMSALRNNRYLNDPLWIAVDETHRDMIEGLEKHYIKNDFSLSVDMFQLKYGNEKFSVKNRGDLIANINYYRLDNGMIKFDKYSLDMDVVFPIQTEVMDNLVVMLPSRSVYSASVKKS